MPLIVNLSREDFLAGLASLQNITGKKGTIAILSNILIQTANDTIEITGTDLEVGIRKSIPAEILEPGSITLPSKKLFEIVRESESDHLHLEVQDNNWTKIQAGSSMYNLAGMPSEEYPAFPPYDDQSVVTLPGTLLRELIDKTYFSIAQEGESQFNLTGVLVEKEKQEEGNWRLKMVSSDGHRLSLTQSEVEADLTPLRMDKPVIIPRKGVQEIRKFCEIYESLGLGFEEKQAVLRTPDAVMVIRLMNGEFPDYRNIINGISREKELVAERLVFLSSMKRMNLFTEDRYNAVKFKIEKESLTLSSQSMDIGNAHDEIGIQYTGEPLELGFNGKYFVDVLQVLSSPTVRVYINSEESPCLIEADGEPGFMSVIMPMKL